MPISAAEPLLAVGALQSGYGKIRVLHGIDFQITPGEVVALLGPNGAGKTTMLRALSGLLPVSAGYVRFRGRDMTNATPREAARAEGAVRLEEALSFFPEIAEKRHERGGALSGGQQQMLTVAQGLIRRPRLLMLDEPSAGLSPVLVDRVLNVIAQLRKQGTAVLLVEQLLEKALASADRVYALVQGHIVLEAPTSEANLPQRLERPYFGHQTPAPVGPVPSLRLPPPKTLPPP